MRAKVVMVESASKFNDKVARVTVQIGEGKVYNEATFKAEGPFDAALLDDEFNVEFTRASAA